MKPLLVFLAGVVFGGLVLYWLTWDWFPDTAALQGRLSGERAARGVAEQAAARARWEASVCAAGARALAVQGARAEESAVFWWGVARGEL
jgi:hypothetical protein